MRSELNTLKWGLIAALLPLATSVQAEVTGYTR
jgi:hypothetical protein